MIQNESLPVWHYGRGHALTCGRITYLGGDPLAVDDPNVYRVEGALRWDIVDGGPPPDEVIWRARLDTQGITPIVYASADGIERFPSDTGAGGLYNKRGDGNP